MVIWIGIISNGYSEQQLQKLRSEYVNLQLRWKHQFQFAGYYAAKEKAYYKKAGLNVEIIEGGTQINTINEVISNRAQYGVSNSEILLHRLKQKPIVVLGAIFQHSPLVLVSRKETNINDPQALIGKSIKMSRASRDIELQAIFLNEGIKLDSLQILEGPYSPDHYFDTSIQAVSAYITNQVYFYEQKNIPYNVLHPRTYGIDFYGDCLFSSEQEINDHPDRVKAFRKASLEGWKYAFNHIDEMIDLILKKYNSKKSREHLQFEAKMMRKLVLPELIELGHMNPGRWQHIADTFKRFDLIENDDSLEGFIYEPNSKSNVRRLYWITNIIILISGFIVVLVIFLIVFNKRLKKEMDIRSDTDKALRESERKYRELFEKSQDAILILKNGKFIDCNQATVSLLGYQFKEELLQIHPSDLSPARQSNGEDSVTKANKMILLALKNNSHRFVWNHLRANGESFPVEVLLTTISNKENNQIIHTVWRDITITKNAEEALRASERKFRLLVENLSQGIYLKDLQGRFIFANKKFWKKWVNSLEDLIGKTDYDIHSEKFAKQYRSDDARIIQTQKKEEIDEEIKLPNGDIRWVQTIKVPFFNDEGDIAGTLGMVWDITEKRKTEKALATSEAELKSFVEALPDIAFIVDENSKYLRIVTSKRTGKKSYVKLKGMEGKQVTDLFPEELARKLQQVVTDTIQSNSSQIVEYELESNGRKSYYEGRTSPMNIKVDDKKTIVWLSRDISDKKRADAVLKNHQNLLEIEVKQRTLELNESLDALKTAQKELVRSERLAALGNMVAGIAHEINTPIGISVTEASYLKDKVKDMRQAYDSDKLTQAKFQKLLSLFDDSADSILRNLSRSANLIRSFKLVAVDQTVLDQRIFNLKEYIEDVILSLRPKLKKTNHSIIVICDDSLSIKSYPGAFSQIITNFVMNSLYHGFAEDQRGQIDIIINKIKSDLHLTFSDDGIGMDEKSLKQVFDPFFTTKRGTGGTGLGMHIVYNIVTQTLKGQIDCISSPKKGFVLNIIFPLEISND